MNLCGWIGLAKEIAAFENLELLLLFFGPALDVCRRLKTLSEWLQRPRAEQSWQRVQAEMVQVA